jgi:hypothetical protein
VEQGRNRRGLHLRRYERGMGLTGPSKLVKGTIDLKVGDVVQVNLNAASMLDADMFPRTHDGWTASMIGKFLPAKGYQMGDLYYFKGPWDVGV